MQYYSMVAPELGEGIRTLKLTGFLKKVGDVIHRDEPLLTVETDKAIMEIESPVSGIIKEYKCSASSEVAVGSEIAVIDTSEIVSTDRADVILPSIASVEPVSELLPNQHRFSPIQQKLIRSFEHSAKTVVQASIESILDWRHIHRIRKAMREKGGGVPKSFEVVSWATAQAMQQYPKLRSRIIDGEHYLTHEQSCLGIAVDCGDGVLKTATVAVDAGSSLEAFVDMCRFQVSSTRQMSGMITEYHSLAISDLSSYQISRAQPIVVYPAVATLFIGSPQFSSHHDASLNPASLVLSFDHRIVNGAEAAAFLSSISRRITQLHTNI